MTALDVVEHAQDDLEIIAEARRVLRPNGTLLVTVPAYQFLWGRHDAFAHHFRRYRAGEVRRLLEGRGLRVTHLTSFNTLLFPPVAGVRIARRLLGATEQPGSDLSMSRPGRVNDGLHWIFASESLLGRRHRLPFGVSILAMAERP